MVSVALAAALAACGGGGGGSTTTSPPPVGSPSGTLISAENAQAGGSGWRLHQRAAPGVLEAYAGEASVQHGETLEVHVRSSVASRVRWEAWRMGSYGGAGGRMLAAGGPVQVGPQPVPSPDPGTGLVACRWPVAFSVQTATSWTSGIYLLVLTRDDGPQTWVPFVVRADERKGVAVFQASFTTYEAYNPWGGKSLYPPSPAVEVSFDRPFAEGNGAGQYFRVEDDFVKWAEARGFDLTYVTNLDVDRDPSLLQGQKLFLSVGHDEYWSRGERRAVEAALASGTSLAFFSGNTSFWQIRLEPSAEGRDRRTQVCWKKSADTDDPLRGTPLETTSWRSPPVNEPENALLGVMFTAWENPPPSAWVVQGASAWPYAGTGVKDGDAIPGIVGYETDRTADNGATPPGTLVLAHSPVTDVSGRAEFQEAAVRDGPAGNFVFAAGTIEWSWGLWRSADNRVRQITENVFRRAGLMPVSDQVPAAPSSSTGAPAAGGP
jgi:hypothetical protein